MQIDPAVLLFASTILGMILFAIILIVGCVRGIRAEQEEAEQKLAGCCCPGHGK